VAYLRRRVRSNVIWSDGSSLHRSEHVERFLQSLWRTFSIIAILCVSRIMTRHSFQNKMEQGLLRNSDVYSKVPVFSHSYGHQSLRKNIGECFLFLALLSTTINKPLNRIHRAPFSAVEDCSCQQSRPDFAAPSCIQCGSCTCRRCDLRFVCNPHAPGIQPRSVIRCCDG